MRRQKKSHKINQRKAKQIIKTMKEKIINKKAEKTVKLIF